MSTLTRLVAGALLLVLLAAIGGLLYIRSTGLQNHPTPGALETRVARTARSFAIPADVKSLKRPAGNGESLYAGMEHYAKYCALCHANNGKGVKTPIGNLYPKPPDLTSAATQQLTDGELFWIIDNGVRFTGMPAFGIGRSTPAGDKQLWELVQFVRHLPMLTPDEQAQMEGLNVL